MSFIAINAKADVVGSKKGKLTPAQNAQLNAFCLSSKTGILDCLNRCEATATNYTASNNIATVVFKKGYVVICGRLVECEEGTEVKVSTPATGTVTGKIILKYNLANSGTQEFIVTSKTGDLIQQDLNANPLTGIYEFELYSYTATPTSVTLTRTQPYVLDISGKLAQFEASLKDEGKPLHGYDDAKGTIEERLTRLGFKEGSVTLSSGTATKNTVTRQGNYVIGLVAVKNFPISSTFRTKVFTLPENFRPKEQTNIQLSAGNITTFYFEINTDGGVYCYVTDPINSFQLNFGFEAPPIEV